MNLAPWLAPRAPFFYGWVVLFSAGTTQVVRNTATRGLIYLLSEDLGWSRTLIAGAASFGGLAASGVSPLVGWLIDRYGTRLVLGLSVLVLGLATISLSWATIPITFYLAYGVGRVIFASPVQIGSSVVVSRWFIRMRGRAIGTLFMSHSIGMIAFPLIASAVIAGRGWQDAWMLLGLLVWAIALLPVVLLMAERPEGANFFGRRSLGAIRGVTEPFSDHLGPIHRRVTRGRPTPSDRQLGPSHRSLGGGLRSDRQLPYRLHRVRLVGGVYGSPGALRQAAATSGTCR